MNRAPSDLAKLRSASPLTRSLQLRRLAWACVEATLFRLSFHTMSRWRAFLLRLFGAEIAPACTIRRTSHVYYPWQFRMGHFSCLGDDAVVYNPAPIVLGDRVTISQEAYLCSGSHDYKSPAMPLTTAPIEIGHDAWICARAFVCPGVRVGDGGIAGAAAVVTRDIEPWSIVGGNPARPIKTRPPLAR